jgi:DNA-directed RNA polymerase specialized sigma24 family protein
VDVLQTIKNQTFLLRVFENQKQLIESAKLIRGIPGTVFYDVFTLFRSLSTEAEKIEAAERIFKKHLKRQGIAKARRTVFSEHIKTELTRRAAERGTTPSTEYFTAYLTNAILAAHAVADTTPQQSFEAFRTRLNDLMSEDLVPDHLHINRKSDLDEDGTACGNDYNNVDIELLSRFAGLDEAELELLSLHDIEGFTFVEIAEQNGEPEATIRQRHHRAIEKMEKIARKPVLKKIRK